MRSLYNANPTHYQGKGAEARLRQDANARIKEMNTEAREITRAQKASKFAYPDSTIDNIAKQMIARGSDRPIGIRDQHALERIYTRRDEIMREKGLTQNNLITNANKLKAADRVWKNFASGRDADAIMSQKRLLNHLILARQLTEAFVTEGGASRTVNHLVNAVAREFNNPAITNYDAAVRFIAREAVRAAAGGIGGVQDANEIAQGISPDIEPSVLRGVLNNTLLPLAAGRLGPYRDNWVKNSLMDPVEAGKYFDQGIPDEILHLLVRPEKGAYGQPGATKPGAAGSSEFTVEEIK